MTLPAKVISIVFDHLWEDIILRVNAGLFFKLLLVNKTFHTIVRRHHRDLMLAYALLFSTRSTRRLFRRFKNPLSNAFVDPGAVLCGMCLELSHARDEESVLYLRSIADFVLTNHKLFDSLIGTMDFPVIFETDPRNMSCATVRMELLRNVPFSLIDDDVESFLLKNVTIHKIGDSIDECPWAVIVRSQGETPLKFYAFRRLDDGALEVRVEKFDLYTENLLQVYY
ncbi:hypothetical protein DFJ77DRAFT_464026 [Powellomyces hirtus]|nr:hypothetical protein DFJ77DRAFT_464026 [Powellomyces hirtus]